MKTSKILVLTLALMASILAANLIVGCSEEKSSNPITSAVTPTDNTVNPIDSADGRKDQMQPAATAQDYSFVLYPIDPWEPLNGFRFGYYRTGHGIHLGDDCVRAPGTPIYAMYDGVVRYARNKGISSGWGYLMIVESQIAGITFCTVYGHMGSRMYPGEGQRVSRLQYIGTVGTTAESGQTSPHLHLGVYAGAFGTSTGNYPGWCKGYAPSTSGWYNPTDFIKRW